MENSRYNSARVATRALWSTSMLALLAIAPAAMAQQQTAASEPVEQVVVSGSRLVTNGAQAPTPVTVVSMEQLQLAAPTNVVDGLLQLPVFLGSSSVNNQSTGTTASNGADNLNLRGLGVQRTLVLVDGRRMVPDASLGAVDAAQIPEALIKRVDVVTGGASAAYGSDAVAGVVNFVLDTHFEGLKVDLQGGISNYGDNANYKFDVTGGQSFMDDHLHIVGSFLDSKDDGVPNGEDRPWTATQAESAITNPNFNKLLPVSPSNSTQIVVHNGYTSVAALGGLITNTTGPAASTSAARRSTPQGQAVPFQYGTNVSVGLYARRRRLRRKPAAHVAAVAAPRSVLHARDLRHQRRSVGLHPGHGLAESHPVSQPSDLRIELDRVHDLLGQRLLAAIASRTISRRNPAITSFTVGRESPDIAIPYMDAITNSGTVTAGFDGKFWSSWTVSRLRPGR